MKPITPQEVRKAAIEAIPDAVIEVVNSMLVKEGDASSDYQRIILRQCDIVKAICEKMDIDKDYVFEHGMLNFEPIFETAGWKVEYDKPAYNETYEATFTFTSKK